MADTQHITRRACLKATPALAVIPSAAVASEPESELNRIFNRWLALWIESYQPTTQAEIDTRQVEFEAIERRMIDLRPTTAQEMARKVAVWYGILPWGEVGGESFAMDKPMKTEIAEMAGIPVGDRRAQMVRA